MWPLEEQVEPSRHTSVQTCSTLDRALARVLAEIHAGLRHGYFEFTLTSEIVGQGKRRLILRAGKHYQFLIGVDECETGDPRDEGTDQSNV